MRSVAPFIGRRAEIARGLDLVREGARAVTLTGLGGVGKTRLLREIGRLVEATEGLPSTLWIDLADLSDPVQLGPRIAASIGAAGEEAIPDALLSRGPVLLLLDNLEQLLPLAGPFLARLLDAAPSVQLLATTRVLLDGAHVIEVGPLEVPGPDQPLASSEAGELLLALLGRRGTADADQAVLGAIIRKISGIPLAIELVAGRLDTLAASEVLSRLDQQLGVLTRPDDGARRWTTMEACIEWSWSALRAEEQSALGHWSLFGGAFHAAWAERTIDGPDGLDILGALRAHSLVQRESRGPGAPLLLIAPPVREFAIERLARRGEKDAALRMHAAAFVSLAREGWHEAIDATSAAASSLAAASREIVTVVVRALEGSVELDPSDVAALFAALGATIEHLRDGYRLVPSLRRAFQRVREAPEASESAMALAAIARIASAFQDAALAFEATDAARACAVDPRTGAEVARARAYTLGNAGHDTEAIESTLEAALPAVRAADDLASEARLWCDLADLARWRLDARTSAARLGDVLDRIDPERAMLGDAPRICSMWAEALLALGDLKRARQAVDRIATAPYVPPTLAVVTRARRAVLEILEGHAAEAHASAVRCIRDPAAFPVVLRRAHMYAALAAMAVERSSDAPSHLRHALRGAPPHERVLIEAIGLLAEVPSMDASTARSAVERARTSIPDGIRPAARAAAEAAFDVVLLCAKPGPPRNRLLQLDAILERPFERSGAAGHHIVVRAIADVVRRMLEARARLDPSPRHSRGSLVLARDGGWLITPGGEWVDGTKRPMIARLVTTLARRGGSWVELPELLAALWPGDRASRATLGNRLHVLVAGTKKLGFESGIESRKGAYRLAVPIEWWDAEP